jgi:hypothetical protein
VVAGRLYEGRKVSWRLRGRVKASNSYEHEGNMSTDRSHEDRQTTRMRTDNMEVERSLGDRPVNQSYCIAVTRTWL